MEGFSKLEQLIPDL